MAEHSVEHSLKFFDELTKIGLDVIEVAKQGIGWDSVGKLAAISAAVHQLFKEAKEFLPDEWSDLTEDEVGQLSKAAYRCIKTLVDAS